MQRIEETFLGININSPNNRTVYINFLSIKNNNFLYNLFVIKIYKREDLTLTEFIEYALNSNQKKEFELQITKEACQAIKKATVLNVCAYTFVIEEGSIRHIRNRHPQDLELLPRIPEILNTFSHVEKSITQDKQTRQNDISLVFRKKYEDGTIQMVALRLLKKEKVIFKNFF